MKRLKRYFIAGLISIVPIFSTIYLLVVIFRFLDGLSGRFINAYLKDMLGFYIPGLGLILSAFAILLIGFFATSLIVKKIFHPLERWFENLPLIKNIYPAFKQLVLFLLAQKEFGFQRVALVEYPSKGIWSIGFMTNVQCQRFNNALNKDMVAVFMPTTPGPFSGYVVFVPKEEVKFPDISVSEALKILISGGVFNISDSSLKK